MAATQFLCFLFSILVSTHRMPAFPLDNSLYFRFFDVGVRLTSDCPHYFDLFAQAYAQFQVEPDAPPAASTIDASVLTQHTVGGARPVLWLDGEMWPLDNATSLRDHLFEVIFTAVAAQVRSHILVHAAVAERNGRAVIIAGDSQHGKSSLALGLLRRGFRLLSDELAAISRTDGTVHPFPRKLRATPRSMELAGYEVAPNEFPLWLGKYLIDVDRLQTPTSAILADFPTPIGDIIVLGDRTQYNKVQPESLRITVERLDDSWLDILGSIDGVEALRADRFGPYPALLIQTQNKVAIVAAVEALCREHRVLCLEVQKRALHRPDFAQAPQLVPLPKSVAVIEMLRHFQGAHSSVILQQEHQGSAISFYLEMADLIGDARCHRLFVGHYEQELDAICNMSH